MLPNAYTDDKGAGAGVAQHHLPPKLLTGGYASWSSDMDVYLSRIGAGGVHKRKMERADWVRLVEKVELWQEEATAEALADIGIMKGSSSSTTSLNFTSSLLHGACAA